jgi:hypothetical protein
MGVGSIRFYGRILNSLFEMVLEEMTRARKSFPCSRPPAKWFRRVDRGARLLSPSSNIKRGKLGAEFICIRF